MDHYSSFAVHPETLMKHGKMTDRFTPWTRVGNIVSNGAFTLEEWSLNRRIIMKKSEHYWDRDNVELNGVVFYPTENVVSEERMFRAGAVALHAGSPTGQDSRISRKRRPELRAGALLGHLLLLGEYRSTTRGQRPRPPRAVVGVRPRNTHANGTQDTAIPAFSITPPDTLGYNPPKLFDHDPEKARQLLAEAGYPNGEGWPGLEIIYNTQEAHRKIAVAVQQMWKSELNIDVTIANQEWKVYLDSVSQRNFQVARRGWIGDYVDANNFLDLFITEGGNNNTGYANAIYDDIILNRAPKAKTRDERYGLFYEAETMLMQEMPIIPIYTYTSKHLVHPSVKVSTRTLWTH